MGMLDFENFIDDDTRDIDELDEVFSKYLGTRIIQEFVKNVADVYDSPYALSIFGQTRHTFFTSEFNIVTKTANLRDIFETSFRLSKD